MLPWGCVLNRKHWRLKILVEEPCCVDQFSLLPFNIVLFLKTLSKRLFTSVLPTVRKDYTNCLQSNSCHLCCYKATHSLSEYDINLKCLRKFKLEVNLSVHIQTQEKHQALRLCWLIQS